MKRHRRNPPRVAIVGAGMCGIAAGVKLRQAGMTNFEIIEAADGVGGTWRANTYPGAAVDVHSAVYQYSFKLQPWLRTHARQSELLEYLETSVKEFGLEPHLRLNSRVEEIRWDEDTHTYAVTINGEVEVYDVVVSAAGYLINPNVPAWPGLDDFRGVAFHTAQWDHSVDLAGKRVAVVGVGSSSAQIVPAIAPLVEQLYVFQREPGWVIPKHGRDYDEADLEQRRSARFRMRERRRLIARIEWTLMTRPSYLVGSRRNRQSERMALDNLARIFEDRPDLREALTPTYPFGGKRRVHSDDFYPALLRPNVDLVPRAVTRLTETGVVDASGTEYPVDVLVIATGFTAWRYLSHLPVYGRDGVELQSTWRDGAYALAGVTLPGYPNFYMLYGPNLNGGGHFSIASLAEQQAGWVVNDLRRMTRHGFTAIETRALPTTLYNRWLQRRLRRTAWAQANNYMRGPNGNVVTQFHGSATLYSSLLRALPWISTYGRRRQAQANPATLGD